MKYLMEIFEFVINNFWKLSILLIAICFSLLFLHKIIKEVLINYKLNRFHTFFRDAKSKIRKKRLAVLTSLVVLPLVFTTSFIQIIRNPIVQYDNYVVEIDNFDQFLSVIHNYTGKFPDNYVRFFEMSSLLFNEEQSPDLTGTTFDYLPNNLELDFLSSDEEYIYILSNEQIDRINITTQELINIPIPLEFEVSSNHTAFPIGIFVDDNHIIVVAHVYEVGSRHFWNSEMLTPNRQVALATQILIFDKSQGDALVNRFEIPGYIEAIKKNDNQLIIVIQEWMKFSNDMDWDNTLPHIIDKSSSTEVIIKNYQQVVYIEGTKPNGFTSLIDIDLDNTSNISHKVLLGDCQQTFDITEQDIYVTSKSYIFRNIAEYFDFFDPIADRRIAMTVFSHNTGDILYRQTKMIPGNIVLPNTFDYYDHQLRLITVDNLSDNIYRVIETNQNGDLTINYLLPSYIGQIANVYFHQKLLFITSVEQKMYVVNISDPLAITINTIEGHSGFPMNVFPLDEAYVLGIDLLIQNTNQLDGLELSIYNIDVAQNTTASAINSVSYQNYGPISTPAFYQPRSVGYDIAHNMITIPISSLDGKQSSTSGILVYKVDNLQFMRFITHDLEYSTSAYRAILLEDYLFVVSSRRVSVWDVNDFEEPVKIISLIKE